MAAGISSTLANGWLNTIRGGGNGVTYTAEADVYFKLHTGNPGTAGTSNASSVTTRMEAQFGAASGGSASLSNTPQWTNWAGTDGEVVSYLSAWTDPTAGNFLYSVQLDSAKTINTGDTFTVNSATVSFTTAS